MIEIKENYLSHQQLNFVWKEIEMIKPLMIENTVTGEAENKKKGYGRLFDSFIARNVIPYIWGLQGDKNPSVLINYFEDGGYYKEHLDDCNESCVLMLSLDENFIGGDLNFPQHQINYKFKNNTFIKFNKILHEVTPIKFIGNSKGRYSINYFIKEEINDSN